ncbi:serine-type peptidase [Grosmannia clavigera kw1407]|uniref:Serine-type peptidase n=1 Tax=Grosmannia clavigera (strain kw1407 / UAMH 11150) TaxID=655863 RepID=F0X966_GROCL|nr:serine-type peptidase [Grosmannia clavigera kw1407]EFX06147.1 serine-type peptidase [Grosmannia clavigera kw1407]
MKAASFWMSVLAGAASLVSVLGKDVQTQAEKIFRKLPGIPAKEAETADGQIEGTFQQLLDHSDASKGTFTQRFWLDTHFWDGPGSPVFLFMAGEEDASGYLGYLREGIPGLYAENFGGLVVVIEHRYFGKSQPFDTLTAETLRFLDLPNSMKDMTYFAQNVDIEVANGTVLDKPSEAPWVLIGGSYSGALAAWIQQKEPGVFFAYHASSAVVETISDFSSYFKPIEEGLPRNCSADVRAVVQYIDNTLTDGDSIAVEDLKAMFGLDFLEADDFAYWVSQPIQSWQDNETAVFAFCDLLEATENTGLDESVDGLGLDVVLPLYADYINGTYGLYCRADNYTICDSHNPSTDASYNDPTDFGSDRPWEWMLCHNPFGWWQVGPNVTDGTNIVSQYITVDWYTRRCALYFPETNGYRSGAEDGWTPEHLDLYTGGWDAPFERVVFVNGEVDPWRDVTVSSDYRDGGRRPSTDDMPVFVVPGGNHCPEMLLEEFDGLPDLYDNLVAIMATWLGDWEAPS